MCELYVVYDTVAKVFSMPLVFNNKQSAIRYFTTSMKDNNNRDDFNLCYIGCYDELNGAIIFDSTSQIVNIEYDDNNNYSICKGLPQFIVSGGTINDVKEL